MTEIFARSMYASTEDLYKAKAEYYEKRLQLYADHIDSLLEGDTHHLEKLTEDLQHDGFFNEDGEFIYPDDEDGE